MNSLGCNFVTKITVGKNEKWVVLIFVVELVRIIMEYVWFFRVINFTEDVTEKVEF